MCAKIKLQCDAIRWPGTICGDVVLDNFNMSYRDEDSILDQKYEQQLFCVLSYEDLKSWKGLKIFDFNIFGLKCCVYPDMPIAR